MVHELGVEEAKGLLASFGEATGITESLPTRVSNKLAEDIVRGVYAPGQPLLEIALAEAFGVSRGPVRDALRMLERENLVTILPRRGASVKALSALDVQQIFGVRAVLYGLVASELARNATPEILAHLHAGSDALDTILNEESSDRFLPLLYRLSMYLARASKNGYAHEILFSQGRQTLSTTRRVMFFKENRQAWAANWNRVVGAIETRDPKAAEHAARTLVETVYASTKKLLDAGPT